MNYNKNYLSKRPFLVVTKVRRPMQGTTTAAKGWGARDEWQTHEYSLFVDRVTRKHQETATVIIDVLEAKAIKNQVPGTSGDEMVQYYLNKYKEQTKQAIGVWMNRQALEKAEKDFEAEERQIAFVEANIPEGNTEEYLAQIKDTIEARTVLEAESATVPHPPEDEA